LIVTSERLNIFKTCLKGGLLYLPCIGLKSIYIVCGSFSGYQRCHFQLSLIKIV
jgi:hypothetical protein